MKPRVGVKRPNVMNARITALLTIVVLSLVACGQAGDGSSTTAVTDSTTTSAASPSTTADGDSSITETTMTREPTVAEAAITHLAAKLGIPENEVQVVEVRIVEWPDGSLGCPEEGKLYTQAVVDGVQVVLQANERIFDYHAGSDGEPFLCPSDERDGGYDFVPPPGFDES
jgi:hypothetical protein